MNTQTEERKAINSSRVSGAVQMPAVDRSAKISVRSKPVYAQALISVLTNGDPPRLMLWGMED